MVIICLSMSMQKDSFLSICKVIPPSTTFHFISTSLGLLFTISLAGEAESGLERLHQCAEKELQVYLTADGPLKDFNEFRTKLAGLTRWFFLFFFKKILTSPAQNLQGQQGDF